MKKKSTAPKRNASSQQIQVAEQVFRSGNADLAEGLLREILRLFPDHSKASELLAYIAGNRGDTELAFELLKKATATHEASAEAFYYVGTAYLQRNCFNQAIASFQQSIKRGGEFFEVLHDLGVALAGAGLHDRALAMFRKALTKNPVSDELFYNIGRTLEALKRYDEALAFYDKGLRLNSNSAKTWYNSGVALSQLRRYNEALDAYDKAILLDPMHAQAWSNRGLMLSELKRHDEALEAYERAIRIQPDIDYLHGNWLHTKMMLCSWSGVDEGLDFIVSQIQIGKKASLPFSLLALPANLATLKKCSEIHTKDRFPERGRPRFRTEKSARNRIRIGYFSADFHNHPTAYLMAELFERHDRSKFEIIAFSFGPESRDPMRQRIESAFDEFIDVSKLGDEKIADLSRASGIQIAVDLKGFTQDSLPGIFACRAAPIQVSYLGYPGTLGANYIDYLIADRTLITDDHLEHYTERIVFLPDTYQVNDSARKISGKKYQRSEMGLPECGFVFACFNNSYKITPDVFEIWMTLLLKIPDSVLWLFEGTRTASINLRKEAEMRGVSPDRLIFAGRLDLPEHLARIQLADLFLDTFHYNAHTTASDALWVGLPVVTCLGQTFAARVAASLLQAIGLPELVTQTHREYADRALELAVNPEILGSIKLKLDGNKARAALFDSALFTRNIEAAYSGMWSRHMAGLAPDHMHV
jgi:predicted O-linked N-acetylglucosamine transferase (SPINDLY family)